MLKADINQDNGGWTDSQISEALDISQSTIELVRKRFVEEGVDYTPKHGSWLNMAEIEFSVLGRQCLDCRIPDKETLLQEVAAFQQRRSGFWSC